VKSFLEAGVDSEQLERIKFQLRAAQIYVRDDVEKLANRYGEALASGLTIEDVQAWPEILQAVTEEDILAAANELLERDHAVTGWLMGEAEEIN